VIYVGVVVSRKAIVVGLVRGRVLPRRRRSFKFALKKV
jgi:hypothetical protein